MNIVYKWAIRNESKGLGQSDKETTPFPLHVAIAQRWLSPRPSLNEDCPFLLITADDEPVFFLRLFRYASSNSELISYSPSPACASFTILDG